MLWQRLRPFRTRLVLLLSLEGRGGGAGACEVEPDGQPGGGSQVGPGGNDQIGQPGRLCLLVWAQELWPGRSRGILQVGPLAAVLDVAGNGRGTALRGDLGQRPRAYYIESQASLGQCR